MMLQRRLNAAVQGQDLHCTLKMLQRTLDSTEDAQIRRSTLNALEDAQNAAEDAGRCEERCTLQRLLKILQKTLKAAVYAHEVREVAGHCRRG